MNLIELIKGYVQDIKIKPRPVTPNPIPTPSDTVASFSTNTIKVRKIKSPMEIDLTNTREWHGVVVHHSASVDGRNNDWDDIKKYHTSWRFKDKIITEIKAKQLMAQGAKGVVAPWRDIGYHLGIELVNDSYVYKVGRPMSETGAHCEDFNQNYIGICMVGCYDNLPLKDIQLKMLVDLIKALKSEFHFPKEKILGHWETFIQRGLAADRDHAWTSYKTCPGKKVSLADLRAICV